MPDFIGLECWSDTSDPEARQDEEFDTALDALLDAGPPPEEDEERPCPACGSGLGGLRCCLIAAAVPWRGEVRDDNR